ncbi:MAG: hypothetical protein ABSB18_07255 [Candidatus Omnitrophota bacterium]
MKIRHLFAIFFFFFLASLCFGEDKTDTEWFPFVIGKELDANSPANIGKIVLDTPAGKHGFVKVRYGHFYFEDGTRAKFWGTNLCFSSCFPTKQQAEMTANRLAFFGFNAVRLHHMDRTFEPEGIFKDTHPESSNPQMKKTGVLSERQLERLDYLIYQLKLRGIYIDMNLLVIRHFTKADSVIAAEQLKIAGKPVSLFDPRLIELQKEYARNLLTHYNPYTKMRYCDDPSIALIEITNENSLFDYWKIDKLNGFAGGIGKNSIPNYYVVELNKRWSDWLMKKYGKTTYFHRPIYKFRKLYSEEQIEDIRSFYLELEKSYFKEMTDFLKKECLIRVPITGIGGHTNIEDIDAQKTCDFIDTHTYWDHPVFPGKIWDEENFIIHNKSMLADPGLGMIQDIIDNAPINKPYTVTEWNQCYPNQYAYEAPLLLASFALKNNLDALFQFSFKHNPSTPPAIDSITNSLDIMENPQQLILSSLGSALFLRSDNINAEIDDGVLTINSPLLQAAVGSIKNKHIKLGPVTIEAQENGAIVLLKKGGGYLFTAIGEVKNTESDWKKNGKFVWGKAPVLLKNIAVKITAKNKIKIYALDNQGARKQIMDPSQSQSPWFEFLLEE